MNGNNRMRVWAALAVGALALTGSPQALGQPVWTPVGSTLDTWTKSYAVDPGIDPGPVGGVCLWANAIRAEADDSSDKFRPASPPLPPSAGQGSSRARAEVKSLFDPKTCKIYGDGSTKVTVEVEGQTLRVAWRVYSVADHRCGDSDKCVPPIPPGTDKYRAFADAGLEAQLNLLVGNLLPGTPVTLTYAWNVFSHRETSHEEAWLEDGPTFVEDTFLEITVGSVTLPIYDADYDFVDMNARGYRDDGIGSLALSGPLPVTIELRARTGAEINERHMGNSNGNDHAEGVFGGELVMVLNGPLPPDVEEARRGLIGVDLEFSLDIGSDTELSDPNQDGDEEADPGDLLVWNEPPRPIAVACSTIRDDALPFGVDPPPTPPDVSTGAPVCGCNNGSFSGSCPPSAVPAGLEEEYFDLDGHDLIDFSLEGLLWVNDALDVPLAEPIRRFYSQCVTPAANLIISYDDDSDGHYIGAQFSCAAPVVGASGQGGTYGTTYENDELLGVSVQYNAVSSERRAVTYGIRDEALLNPCLAPNPDPVVSPPGEESDDDVDALAIHRKTSDCNTWLFSADHEALYVDPIMGFPLESDLIYEVLPGGDFVSVIDPCIHLGMPAGCEEVDIDAFTLVWTPNGNTEVLTFLFSVDDDDWLTPGRECGGWDPNSWCALDPNMIYASYLTGDFFAFLEDPLMDDIDALTAWWRPLVPAGGAAVFFEPDRATIPAGESITLKVFLQNTVVGGRGPLRAYQMTFPQSATPFAGATGTLSDTPGFPGPNVDNIDPAFVFGSASGLVSFTLSESPPVFGADAPGTGDSVNVLEPRYLGEVVYTASADASGEFEIDIVNIPIDSFLKAQNLANIPFTVKRPARIRVDAIVLAPATEYSVDGPGPTSVAMGDLDGDGDLDLAVANFAREDAGGNLLTGSTVGVLSNNGSGGFPGFTSISTGATPHEVAIGDVDNDGDLDIAVANLGSNDASVLRNNGAGGFTVETFAAGNRPYSVVIEDFDGDGVRDLAVGDRDSGDVMVFLNTGTFNLTQTISVGGSPVIRAVDVDADGDVDLAVVYTGSGLILLLNDGGATFALAPVGPIPIATAATSLAVGDLDADGDLDLVVGNQAGDTITVLINDGTGAFPTGSPTYPVGSDPVSVTIADLNRDGHPDVAVANWRSDDVTVLMNTGLGTFTPAGTFGVGSFPSSIAAGDVDRDNDLDLVVTNQWSDSISVLLNLYPSGNINPSPANPSVSQTYYVSGGSTGIGWSWSVHGEDFNVWDLNAAGVSGGTADDLAAAFVASINSAGSPTVSASVTPGAPSSFTITANAGESFSLSIGAAGLQPANTVAPGLPFSFNPEIGQVLLTAADCDGNGVDDAIDIATNLSEDANDNGVPDKCENCGDPGAGDCFVGNGTPSCSNAACCNLICTSNPLCCDVAWDQFCAGEALLNCQGAPECTAPWQCDDADRCTVDRCMAGTCEFTDFNTLPCTSDGQCFGGACAQDGFCRCPAPQPGCCRPDGSCATMPANLCTTRVGGTVVPTCRGDADWDGTDDACEAEPEACCTPNGGCVDGLDQASCEIGLGGAYLGAGTTCAGDANGDGISDGCALGACCDPDMGDCVDTHKWECRRCTTTGFQCSTDADCWPDESCTTVNWRGARTPDDFEYPVCHGGTFDTGLPCTSSFDCDGGAGECYAGERCNLDAPCDTGACCGDDGTCSEVDGPGNCPGRHCAKDPTLPCLDDLTCIIGPTDLGPCEDKFLGFGSECEPNCCPQTVDSGGDCCADIYECTLTGQSCNPVDPGACDSGADGTCVLVCAGPILFDISVPPLIPPGQKVTLDLTSDSTGATSTAADVCASGSDPTWYHSFAVDDCAVVTWTFCCNEPWIPAVSPTLISNCPCDGGVNVIDPNPGRSGFGDGCGNDYCCPDGNYSVEWTVRAGTYAYQIPAGKVCDGTAQACVTDADCPAGVQCVDLRRAYQAHLTVGPCMPAACCHGETCSFLNKFECEDTGGVYLGDLTPNPIVDCFDAPCSLGACCLSGGGCEPAAGGQLTVPECDALGGDYQGGVTCADDTCADCNTDADCDDGVGCTADSCNAATDSCDNLPNDTVCDNGEFCDGVETCNALTGCEAGAPVDCDDGVGCTTDSCNAATDSCDNLPNDTACDNGDVCDGVETCDPVVGCQPGTPINCLNPLTEPQNPVHHAPKHRYISVDATTNLPDEISIKVEIAEMNRCQNDLRRSCIDDADCPTVCAAALDLHSCGDGSICPDGVCIESGPCVPHPDVGLSWFVQEPQTRGAACPNGMCDEEDYYARVGPDPWGSDWKADCEDGDHIPGWTGGCATLHIGDCEIVPGVEYNVYACDPVTGDTCSDPLAVKTTRKSELMPHYGDVAGPVTPALVYTPPDNYTSVIDIGAYLLTLKNWGTTNLPQAHPTWIDLHGPGPGIPPQYILMVTDLSMILRAFVDIWPYENSIGGLAPGDCP